MPNQRRNYPAPRRVPEWSGVIVAIEGQGLAAGQSFGDTNTAAEATIRNTVARVRGSCLIHLTAGAASDSMIVGVGLGVVNADAFAIGSTSVPSPLDDAEWSWLWHGLFVLGPCIAADSVNEEVLLSQRKEIDGKAMRKMTANETLFFIADGVILSGSPTFKVNAAVRFLFLNA